MWGDTSVCEPFTAYWLFIQGTDCIQRRHSKHSRTIRLPSRLYWRLRTYWEACYNLLHLLLCYFVTVNIIWFNSNMYGDQMICYIPYNSYMYDFLYVIIFVGIPFLYDGLWFYLGAHVFAIRGWIRFMWYLCLIGMILPVMEAGAFLKDMRKEAEIPRRASLFIKQR